MKHFFFAILVGCGVGLWEIAVTPFLPSVFQAYPILPTLVLLSLVTRFVWVEGMAFAAGLMLDLFLLPHMDVASLRYPLVGALVFFLVHQVFTHRSLTVALVTGLIARTAERLLAWLFGILVAWLTGSAYGWASQAVWWRTYAWDALVITLGFLGITFFSRRFFPSLDRSSSASWYAK